MTRPTLPAALVALAAATSAPAAPDDARLIVQITVDGLRGELTSRYMDGFGEDGFRRLVEGGVWYTNAHRLHANTETIVGHATLATGAHPSEHGMIGNAWLDRATGALGYNIEDAEHPLVPVPGFEGEGVQVDPAQAAAQASGRSPANLPATTFADELRKSNNGRSKAFSVSGKDRSAVAMAGHAGKAFWMSTATGAFETSRWYYDAYPQWVIDWNAARPADAAIGGEWALSDPLETYLLAENDDRPYETDLRGYGRVFPHRFGDPSGGLYYTQVLVSPLGDELVADFAKAAVRAEGLGDDGYVDYLSLGFSAVDAVNHFFGPSSLENEEVMRRLDRTLADLFAFLDAEIGRDVVLYVLSSDHGMPEIAEFAAEAGFATERNHGVDLQAELNAELFEAFGVRNAIKLFFRPYVYFDHDAVAAAGADPRAVERAVVDSLTERPGIAFAMPREPFPDQRGSLLEAPILRNHHPQRSGDVYVVQAPYSFLMDEGAIAVMHGSPWAYDTHVPIVFAGPGIDPAKVSRRVATAGVAVTLADLFGVGVPSGAAGAPLTEVSQ